MLCNSDYNLITPRGTSLNTIRWMYVARQKNQICIVDLLVELASDRLSVCYGWVR